MQLVITLDFANPDSLSPEILLVLTSFAVNEAHSARPKAREGTFSLPDAKAGSWRFEVSNS